MKQTKIPLCTKRQAEIAKDKSFKLRVSKTSDIAQKRLELAERQEIERDLKAMGLWDYSAGGEL